MAAKQTPASKHGEGKRKRRRRDKGGNERKKDRQLDALRLRQSGLSYRAIAASLKVSLQVAYSDVQESLAELHTLQMEEATALRDLELARLDEMLMAMFLKAKNGDVQAVDRVIKIGERRAKLLGLDSPDRHELLSGMESVMAEIERRRAAAGLALGPASAAPTNGDGNGHTEPEVPAPAAPAGDGGRLP